MWQSTARSKPKQTCYKSRSDERRTRVPVMSSSFSAAQFNSAFSPTKLCNWEIPAIRERKVPKFHPAKTGMTPFIASDNGHLLRGKKMTSFQTGYETSAPPARWPEHTTLSSSSYGGAATMGYKGIETTCALPIP